MRPCPKTLFQMRPCPETLFQMRPYPKTLFQMIPYRKTIFQMIPYPKTLFQIRPYPKTLNPVHTLTLCSYLVMVTTILFSSLHTCFSLFQILRGKFCKLISRISIVCYMSHLLYPPCLNLLNNKKVKTEVKFYVLYISLIFCFRGFQHVLKLLLITEDVVCG